MTSRPSSAVLAVLGSLFAAFTGCFIDAGSAAVRAAPALDEMRALAGRLGLTDLALFTEARYTRHPTQADLHAPFQDHPLAFEHFPSGSLLPPNHEALARETAASD